MKCLDDMTPEDLAKEAQAWDRGDFADGTWYDATPEATAANERYYYLTGEDGIRRAIVSCAAFHKGSIFSRGRGAPPRVFLEMGRWLDLNEEQRHGLCQLIWAGTDAGGELVILDAETDAVIATYLPPAITGASW